jgi:hypothetical protein
MIIDDHCPACFFEKNSFYMHRKQKLSTFGNSSLCGILPLSEDFVENWVVDKKKLKPTGFGDWKKMLILWFLWFFAVLGCIGLIWDQILAQ